jgi:dihydrofolate reductase
MAMRKLILQMQMSADGFVSDADSGLGWLVWDWSDKWTWDAALKRDFNAIFASVGCILLSRKMAEEGYLGHWGRMAEKHAGERDFAFAEKIRTSEKAIISRKLRESKWERTRVVPGGMVKAVTGLKGEKGGKDGDIIVFGGVGFASALVSAGLVDEFQFFVNPRVLGTGHSIFKKLHHRLGLKLIRSDAYKCGVVVNRYSPLSDSAMTSS